MIWGRAVYIMLGCGMWGDVSCNRKAPQVRGLRLLDIF